MDNNQNQKPYNLGERTKKFAEKVRGFVKNLPNTLANIEDARQLIKASGSVGANYIEAEEALSKKDFAMKIKICRKEAKESRYWLDLVEEKDKDREEKCALSQEAMELTKIFGAIVEKLK